ncbi:MAG: acetyltransferase [Coriobacteriia bacterium]
MTGIVILGAGGHARVVIDALRAQGLVASVAVGASDDTHEDVMGVPVLAGDEQMLALRESGLSHAALGIGSVGDVRLRRGVAEEALGHGFVFEPIVHPSAVVSATASLGRGVFVAAGAVVGPGATLDEFAIINTGAIVDHDCHVGSFAHIAPAAALSGDVVIGAGAHVGTGACIIQGVVVGDGAIIGAGSAVVSDIPAGVTAYGSPCSPVSGGADV